MLRDREAYLWDIAKAIALIEAYAGTHTQTEFAADRFAQTAVERNFEIIGEAIKQAERLYPGSMATLPKLTQLIRLRDRLAHGYFSINVEILWEAAIIELPVLKAAVTALLPTSSKE